MVEWQEFAIDSVRAMVFTPDHSAFASGRVVATILRRFAERFSGEMEVLPIPADAPPELPRVVLQSSDTSEVVNVSPARFGYIWKRTDPGAMLALPEAVQQCIEVLQYYVGETRVRVGRVGLVVQRFCVNDKPGQTLIQRFCNEKSQLEPLNRSATFEIHNHKQYRPDHEGVDYEINSWVRCRCGAIGPEKTPAIMVTQDLNTMAADLERRQFDANKIGVFFLMASKEAETILKKYFPQSENDNVGRD